MRLPTLPAIGRTLAEILIGAAVVFLLAFLLWRIGALNAIADKLRADAIVQQETAKATGDAASSAITITNEVHREITRIDEITRRNEDAIQSAAGADAQAPAVAAALRSALCLRDAYRDSPACKTPVPGDGGSERPVERDGWGPPP